jgi:hypothetical protein
MALSTTPPTPEQEAARINAAAGIQPGEEPAITAEQVASNKAFNDALTNALGFGEGGTGFDLSSNPFAKLVSGISDSLQASQNSAVVPTSSNSTSVAKASLNDTISRLSGGVGSGLNGATAGNSPAGEWDDNLGEYVNVDAALQTGGAVDPRGVWDDNLGEYVNVDAALQGVNLGATGPVPSTSGSITSALSKLTGGSLGSGIQSIAGSISTAAKNINSFLGGKPGNFPPGAELFTQTGQEIKLNVGAKADWRVRINTQWQYFASPLFAELERTGGVVFPIQPSVSLTTTANYNTLDPVHSNYPFQAYKNSQVNDIMITGKFPADTERDAAYWIGATTFFRTATKMFYGQGENAGNPPPICNLSGYGASIFDNIPVVIKSFNIELPDDVNYRKCDLFGTSTWVPILSTISVTVAPIYNRRNLRKFNLKDFAAGRIPEGGSGVGYL